MIRSGRVPSTDRNGCVHFKWGQVRPSPNATQNLVVFSLDLALKESSSNSSALEWILTESIRLGFAQQCWLSSRIGYQSHSKFFLATWSVFWQLLLYAQSSLPPANRPASSLHSIAPPAKTHAHKWDNDLCKAAWPHFVRTFLPRPRVFSNPILLHAQSFFV